MKTTEKDYTIVEPHFEYFDRHKDGYLKFLERCTRVCYKSEDQIREGSAEKLLNKVVNEYKHLSVTEHESCILKINHKNNDTLRSYVSIITCLVPLFGHRWIWLSSESVMISGNVRMWRELIDKSYVLPHLIWAKIESALAQRWPFFFSSKRIESCYDNSVDVLDDNPITNKDKLSVDEMKMHMTLTYKLIGDRSMSHQLVRHRMCAFSQESQRYCNYGKKGFQFIVPPSVYELDSKVPKNYALAHFTHDAVNAYDNYLVWIDDGIKPEDARGLLPNCTKTEVVTTATLGMWEHIFEHRANNPKAQWQIRGITQGIQEHAKNILPGVFT